MSDAARRQRVRSVVELERSIKDSLAVVRKHSQDSPTERVTAALSALESFDRLSAELYQVRKVLPANDTQRQMIEDGASDLGFELLAASKPLVERGSPYRQWLKRYRSIWRRELPLLWFCIVFFAASSIIGYNTATRHPEYVPVLVPQALMENILDQEPWFQRIQDNPLLAGAQIALNNMKVALNCFLGGALLGLGGLVLVCFNGVHLGSIFGYCVTNGFEDELGTFILSHGFLELSIIIAAGATSLVYGRAFYLRPVREFPRRFMQGARDAGVLAAGIIPWLLFAACFEAFVSPYPIAAPATKMIIGIIVGALFWTWTFWPETSQ